MYVGGNTNFVGDVFINGGLKVKGNVGGGLSKAMSITHRTAGTGKNITYNAVCPSNYYMCGLSTLIQNGKWSGNTIKCCSFNWC